MNANLPITLKERVRLNLFDYAQCCKLPDKVTILTADTAWQAVAITILTI